MNKKTRFLALLLALLMVLPLASCGSDEEVDSNDKTEQTQGKDQPSKETTTQKAKIELAKDSAVLEVGQTMDLSNTYVLKNCKNTTVAYESSSTAVATVSANGLVTAVSVGEAVITLAVENGMVSTKLKLTVVEASGDIEPDDPDKPDDPDDPDDPDKPDDPKPPVSYIELSFTELTLNVGESKQIAYTLFNCVEGTVATFATSSASVKVNANGLIEAVSEGSAIVTVSALGCEAVTIKVTVNKALVPESTVPHYEPTLEAGVKYVDYTAKNVKHVFFHNLIAFEDTTGHFDKDCLYVSEFKAILEQLYANNYVLINIDYIYDYYEENGVLKAKLRDKIKVPEGKIPLIISVDNVCYPSDEHGLGRVDRLVVKNGKLYTYTKLKDGTDYYSDDNEVFTILENFIALHPDFSFSGARCVVAPSGYAGLFGYNTTSKATAAEKATAQVEVAKIVDWFRGNGYTFACHSYSHGDYSTMTIEKIRADFDKWNNEVLPYIGRTYVFIYPFGNFTTKGSEQAKELSAQGYAVFCATSMNGINWNNFPLDGNCYNERIILDGQCLRKYADHENMKALFDAYSVYDNTQRKIQLVRPNVETAITLNKSAVSLEIGGTAKLSVTLKGLTGKVTFSSDNPCVSVDGEGNIQALAAGRAQVTATCGLYSASCIVTVSEPAPQPKIELSCYYLTMHVGDVIWLEATSNVPGMTYVWTTSNEEAVFVDDGNVEALVAAEAVIVRVTAGDGSCYAECMIDIV